MDVRVTCEPPESQSQDSVRLQEYSLSFGVADLKLLGATVPPHKERMPEGAAQTGRSRKGRWRERKMISSDDTVPAPGSSCT